MFKPEKLVRVTIQVPAEFISAATATLAKFRLLHLIRIGENRTDRLGYVAETDDTMLKESEALFQDVNALLEGLDIRPQALTLKSPVIPEKEIFRVRERLAEVKKKVDSFLGGLRMTSQALIEHKSALEKFDLLPADLDLSRLQGCKYVNWMIGLVPVRGLEKLEESLSQFHHVFIHIGTLAERVVMLVFGLKDDWPVFERALKGAFFEQVELPRQVSGTVGQITARLRSEMAQLEEKKNRLFRQRNQFQKDLGPELLLLKEKIVASRNILAARQFFGKIEKSYLVSGWIPERFCEPLHEALKEVTRGEVIFEKVDPEALIEVRSGIIKIPILFNNPLLISPFERLTSLYGTPRYKEVEPTVFFALSFLLMFGMMFGDVGHGAVLFFTGHLMFRRFYKYIDYGIILMECGFVSALFGFLYGSIFGVEELIPALWFRPMNDIVYFVKVAFILGIALVSLGFILNLINSLRLKEYHLLLSTSGLGGALFYWTIVGLSLKYFLVGQLAKSELTVFGWVAAVLTALIIFHRPLHRLLVEKERFAAIVKQKGFFAEILESIVEFFDDLIRYVANTISFIRVAAFALAHAALFVAVFSIADLVARGKWGGVWYWIVLTIGNLVIIVLEGLVVSIQVVRLEYYEFFSRFFRGGGEKFRPFDREISSRGKGW